MDYIQELGLTQYEDYINKIESTSYYDYITGTIGLIIGIVLIALFILSVVSYWKIYTKADEHGWAILIPFYRKYIFFKITWSSGWYFLLSFMPVVNVALSLIKLIKLSQAFDKSPAFTAGLIFLPVIFVPILAFGSSEYVGTQ